MGWIIVVCDTPEILNSNVNIASSILKEYESPTAAMTAILSAAIVASRSGLRNK
jgi:hypothetical protein